MRLSQELIVELHPNRGAFVASPTPGDLHDVFGRTLSTVALKAELAAEQARRGRPESVATMREVQSIATDALEEVREVVRGYRQTDLADEMAGARSLLEASGIEVTTVTEGSGVLPSREWKRARFNQAWYPGETVIAGIGPRP